MQDIRKEPFMDYRYGLEKWLEIKSQKVTSQKFKTAIDNESDHDLD